MLQRDKNREVILADMHDDGVHFNRALLEKQKQMKKKDNKKNRENEA